MAVHIKAASSRPLLYPFLMWKNYYYYYYYYSYYYH